MNPKNTNASSPSICIVLINWNQLTLTMECLESIFKMDYTNFKVVLVDNNSKEDPTKPVKEKYPEVEILRQNSNLGFAEGNNVGFRYAYLHHFDLIMALNNDTIVSPNFITPLITELKNNQALAAVSPKIYFKHAPTTIWAMGGMVSLLKVKGFSYQRKQPDTGQFENNIETDYLTGCCLLIHSKILKELNGFDSDYFAYYEDTDLSFRLRKKGYQLLVVSKSIIWHVAGGSSRTNRKKPPFLSYLGTRNKLFFFRQHYGGVKRVYASTTILLQTTIDIIFYFLTVRPAHSLELLKALKDGFKRRCVENN